MKRSHRQHPLTARSDAGGVADNCVESQLDAAPPTTPQLPQNGINAATRTRIKAPWNGGGEASDAACDATHSLAFRGPLRIGVTGLERTNETRVIERLAGIRSQARE
jgi:hypothetical protein